MTKPFTDEEAGLIVEALYDLMDAKTTAMATLNEGLPGRKWVPNDFGIPTIQKLIHRFEEEENPAVG